MEALKGFIFDMVRSKSADLFVWTLKQIGGHIGHTYQYGEDIHRAVEMLTCPHLATPTLDGGIDPWHKQFSKSKSKSM